jgi:type IV pilus assembly protein PilO
MALSMDSILKLSTRRKILLLVVLLGVIAVLFTYLVFLPQKEELDRLKVELNTLTKELNEAKAITRDLPKFKEQAALLERQLAEAITQLPNEKEIPEILKKISSLGKESRLEFTLFRPKPEEPQQFYAKVPIELVALGNYHDMGMFFDRVSKLQRIINVVDFNMTRAKDVKGRAETENLIRASCLMNTYRFIERKPEEKKGEKTSGKK